MLWTYPLQNGVEVKIGEGAVQPFSQLNVFGNIHCQAAWTSKYFCGFCKALEASSLKLKSLASKEVFFGKMAEVGHFLTKKKATAFYILQL